MTEQRVMTAEGGTIAQRTKRKGADVSANKKSTPAESTAPTVKRGPGRPARPGRVPLRRMTIALEPELFHRVEELADATGKSANGIIGIILRDYLNIPVSFTESLINNAADPGRGPDA